MTTPAPAPRRPALRARHRAAVDLALSATQVVRLYHGVGAAALLLGLALPDLGQSRAVMAGLAAAMLLVTLVLAVRPRPLSRVACHVACTAGVVSPCLLVATGGDGPVGAAYGTYLVWTTLFAATFFSPRATAAYAALGVAGLAAAGSAAHPPATAVLLAVVTTSAVGAVTLVTARVAAARALGLITDPVTTLLDGRGLPPALERELARTEDEGAGPLAVLVVSVDRFRDVNDAFGHRHGDDVLSGVARALLQLPVEPLLVARLAGDEFVLAARPSRALPRTGLTGAEWAAALAERLRTAVAGPYRVRDVDVTLETSVGCVLAPQHGRTAETLLRRAERAVLEAKAQGLGVQVWQPAPDTASATDMLLLAELRGAGERGELRLRYQPQCEAATGRLRGLEALVRWQHPRLGLLSPASFVELAERTDTIVDLTDWVLAEAARQCRAWRDQGLDLEVSVNVSTRVLHGGALVPQLRSVLAEHGLPPSALRLEITETTVLRRPERAALVLGQLRELGVAVSVDDFGTGYTSLAMLSELPLDELKLDARFVSGLLTRPADAAIATSVLELAHRLGLVTVAEGVEDEETAEELRRIGYDTLQGYLFAPPLDPAALPLWLRAREAAAASPLP
ncbi:putative bifunctional diguanylate cyclase/phosphodiesterase [Vallicoccus soli]|uniref:Bifunctional diguanylate cyclase/phosphodiesterase n=1 Tax=Vallicoccus soli TaxID=2339232 RepID=A0A3A3ZCR4_9ACTN|nr:bifunctional diguanylate cyclase/phosphodiesterase [Vallicoccus soli]RJK92764.1 bifunctional diguanylate cyclase/phosphodiesterase [Vallicoccus soli]